ncbi:PilW family protein [Lysobacter niastensis]|uniref:Prepilin-type N-terminal cleavage/methylation domain-containing protein n=1 Tax=Lysobacter niastensis TaxID=380629 RepID=A0ABS0B2Q0_9GAMM|nr:prepilin-type N-terminal cleavage/methylation domain-containing protein [Lysobacter niastensis]MBF6022765.1 prepilin-type N-terminal cleavage/methylation domain-containing protein [Lysobacter niastensis]
MMVAVRKQAGFSLVELMVALVAGMIVVGAVLAFALSSIRASSEYVRTTRLTQELRTSLETATDDLRRAGFDEQSLRYVARPPSFTETSPFSRVFISTNASCVIYAYDRKDGTDGTLDLSNGEVRGIRRAVRSVNGRNVGVLEMAESSGTTQPDCTGGSPDYSTFPATCTAGWCPLSDPRLIDITAFQVVNDRPATSGVPGLIATGSGPAVLPMQLRKLQVTMSGSLISMPTVIRTITTDVRVRADCVRAAAATNCIAVPNGT